MTKREREADERRSTHPHGYGSGARAKRLAQKECTECWVVGGHDPRCWKLRSTQKMNAARRETP